MDLYSNDALYAALKELSIIPEGQLSDALQTSNTQRIPLGTILLDTDLIHDDQLGRVLADLFSLQFIRVSEREIPHDVLHIIPEVFARKNGCIVFSRDEKGIHLATSSPKNTQMIEFIRKKTSLPVLVYFTTDREIRQKLTQYSPDVVSAFHDIIQENIQRAKDHGKADPPVIKIVETIFSYGYQNKASDIHIEPSKNFSLVRFRVDGILHDILRMPVDLHARIVTRIKVLAKLRIDEHQAPQDGKLQFVAEDEDVDVRVSIIPVTEGENIVLRLLSAKSRRISLTDLGCSGGDLEKIHSAYQKPYGMILATGPTGSGKTTSLYAILKLLNKREVNIMTIEDPVEYEIGGISQIQVNPKTHLTFAEGLRSIVRQDPNIILVGEIRDEETAGIAINAAMTGHLVLSTLHTNDSATAIPRLLEMHIEPFLISSSVNVIIAQRLVRHIHTGCRVSEEIRLSDYQNYFELQMLEDIFGASPSVRVYSGKGCQFCHFTGYEGRVGIFEVLVVDDEVRVAIVSRKDASFIRQIAEKNGMTRMIRDGLVKVKAGITTIHEVIRVTKE